MKDASDVYGSSGKRAAAPCCAAGLFRFRHPTEIRCRRELGGRVELNYAPAGLVVEIVAPLGSVS
jgi:hypothetical protein